MKIADLKVISASVRKEILKMLQKAGSGHPGGSLSAVELLVDLYNNHMNFNKDNFQDKNRDYFILSKGHVCPVLYAVLAQIGCFPKEELNTLRQLGSRLQGHPAKDKHLPGIEVSTGSLGYGLSIALGIAKGIKTLKQDNRVYVLMGDGEQQEGSIWEAVMCASHFKLDNLCAIIDCNNLQIDGKVEDILNIYPISDKYRAFGWNVIEIDGHNLKEVDNAYIQAKNCKEKPTVIIAQTIKGKGVSFMENVASWHGKTPNAEQLEQALKEIDASLK